jgi:hypothetical protein
MSFLTPKAPPPPPPPPPPPSPDRPEIAARTEALTQEAMTMERRRRRGRGSTIIAGALEGGAATPGQQPTLMS